MNKKVKNPFKILWLLLGLLSLALGTIGIILPILPTVPFYMLTVFCFARSSKRLHKWFVGTGLYKKHLEGFVVNKSMTLKSKVTVMGMATIMMSIGFWMMDSVPIGRVCLGIVWVFHVFYFTCRIKTKDDAKEIVTSHLQQKRNAE